MIQSSATHLVALDDGCGAIDVSGGGLVLGKGHGELIDIQQLGEDVDVHGIEHEDDLLDDENDFDEIIVRNPSKN